MLKKLLIFKKVQEPVNNSKNSKSISIISNFYKKEELLNHNKMHNHQFKTTHQQLLICALHLAWNKDNRIKPKKEETNKMRILPGQMCKISKMMAKDSSLRESIHMINNNKTEMKTSCKSMRTKQ